ncbi:MAG: DUF5668 domain-containing protein [Patescibacteria group bacterium]
MFGAFLLIILGLVFLFKNLGFISGDAWGIIWPLLIIALGVSLVSKKRTSSWHWPWCDKNN